MSDKRRLIALGVQPHLAQEIADQIDAGGFMENVANSENQEALIELIGNATDAPWNFSSPNPSIIALLKAIANNTRST